MAILKPKTRTSAVSVNPIRSERPFWQLAGASWRQIAGGFNEVGFSFEWHEWDAAHPLQWAESFHPDSVEICLNLHGGGWVSAGGDTMHFGNDTVGFLATRGLALRGERNSGQQHRFLSVEFGLSFLKAHLAPHSRHLHPTIQSCFDTKKPFCAVSGVTPMTHRHRELLNSLLRPPVLACAQRFWFQVKALEFAAEFFFVSEDGETLCTRTQRMAAERVSRAKAILLEDLSAPPSLEELGRRVACSHFYLSRTFTRETGLTISQWLRRARLEKAAELLKSGKCNVTEAALEVGYSSLSHFSEAFHEMYGCCPGLYPLRTSSQQQQSLLTRESESDR